MGRVKPTQENHLYSFEFIAQKWTAFKIKISKKKLETKKKLDISTYSRTEFHVWREKVYFPRSFPAKMRMVAPRRQNDVGFPRKH